MSLQDFIVIAVIVVIIGLALAYIIKAKKSGQKCIGCPDAKNCGGSCGTCAYTCSKNPAEKQD